MFWDSSAVVPLLVAESRSAQMAALLHSDRIPAIWWGNPVECQSALHRRRRERLLSPAALAEALTRLDRFTEDVDIVAPTKRLRERAGRVLHRHPLRAADALHLAAAIVWSDEAPAGEAFVCLDDRLRDAARQEGFETLPERLKIG
jgi:predicted nucleic acid-binding protein